MSWKWAATPWSRLAEAMASLMAKNADAERKKGGSPTACSTSPRHGIRDTSHGARVTTNESQTTGNA